MKVLRISNSSELITSKELMKGLEGTDFLIFPKLPISEVIDNSISSLLSKKEKKFFNTSHFDFTVSTSDHTPLFAVEFDGPHHNLYEKTIIRDIRKNRICQIAELPLIRITDDHLESYETISIVQFMAYRFAMWQENFLKIKKEIELAMENMSDEELRQLHKDGFVRAEFDPYFQFDIRYPFPKKDEIKDKLINKFKLNYFFPNRQEKDTIGFMVSPGNEGSKNGLYYTESTYGVYKGYDDNNLSWKNGKILNKNIKVLLENKVRVAMKWALITADDYDPNESPISYEQRKGFLPIYHGDISGANIPSIAKAIAEFLSFNKILEWSKKNIIR